MQIRQLSLLLLIIAPACGGCIMYAADSPFVWRGTVRHFGDEMNDLKSALDRGAITLEEYEHEKSALESSFQGKWGLTTVDESGNGTHASADGRDRIVVRPLTREQVDQLTPRMVEPE